MNTNTNTNTNRPRSITSPVLENIIPKLLEHRDLYGHPNIALGTSEGRQCQTLRRLHIQQKLSQDEIEWLEQIGFRFNSLEDVYFEADFDDLFQKLKDYERIHQNRYQVPKKYNEDPELGAWVTGIRRLGTDRVHPKHKEMLDSIDFTWISLRQCGSKFMKKYRDLVARAQQTNAGPEELLQDESVISWLTAQRQARKRGTLSDTRMDYMNQLFGEGWMDANNNN